MLLGPLDNVERGTEAGLASVRVGGDASQVFTGKGDTRCRFSVDRYPFSS